MKNQFIFRSTATLTESHSSLFSTELPAWHMKRRRASTFHEGDTRDEAPTPRWRRRRTSSFHATGRAYSEHMHNPPTECALPMPPPCTCPYFGMKQEDKCVAPPAEVKIVSSGLGSNLYKQNHTTPTVSPIKKSALSNRSRPTSSDSSPNNIVVTWESKRGHRRGKCCFR